MVENKMNLLPQRTHQAFCQMFSGLPRDQINALSDLADEILLKAGRGAEIVDYYEPVKIAQTIFSKKTENYSKDSQVLLKRSLLAKLALNLPTIVEKMDLPKKIFLLYPNAFDRLADHLKTNCADPYDLTDDFFLKDIRFVLGLSIPCSTTHVLDMISKVSLRSVILSLFWLGNVKAIIQYARIKGYGPWFRVHTDPRRLNDFNEQGWDNCFLRIAELLERRKDIRGLVGTSWFYDPQLLKISPRLAYLRQRPLERGAFLLRHRTGGIDIEYATRKSETRLRLYQEGKYTPIVLSIVWPRKDLISWADQARRGK
jgi:hypothetical protein